MTTTLEGPRISIKRLRAEITRVNDARKFNIGQPPYPGPFPGYANGVTQEEREAWFAASIARSNFDKETSAERATRLYSLRSHLHGTLHITHQYVQVLLPNGDCKDEVVVRTMDDQAKLIAPLVQEFAMTPEELAAAEAARRARVALYGTPEEKAAL